MTRISDWRRLWQHWLHPRWRVARYFPADALHRLSLAIAASERQHAGQIRFVIESGWDSAVLLRGLDTRRRAWQWFGELGVWNTEHNSGVLVYVSVADHRVEIVADRGLNARIDQAQWQGVCDRMVAAFSREHYVPGLEQGLAEIGALLVKHWPRSSAEAMDELPNDVLLH